MSRWTEEETMQRQEDEWSNQPILECPCPYSLTSQMGSSRYKKASIFYLPLLDPKLTSLFFAPVISSSIRQHKIRLLIPSCPGSY